MTPVIVAAQSTPAQAWRNGGGQTRELLTWPADGAWRLRISRADIAADGPFSSFPGVTRWFTVLRGDGVALTLDGEQYVLQAHSAALRFDGALAPACRLLAGPTQDLNLMAVGGDCTMERAIPGEPWLADWQMRGLYTTVAGHWQCGTEILSLQADTLLWQSEPLRDAGWTFTPQSNTTGSAWWVGFTP